MSLNQVEEDFIEFITKKKNQSYDEFKKIFIETREFFKFNTLEYRNLVMTIFSLNRILYNDTSEIEILDAMKYHELINLFRMISYSYPSIPQSRGRKIKSLMKTLLKFQVKKVASSIKQKIFPKQVYSEPISNFIIKNLNKIPIILDYGCGLGYLSYEIAKIEKNSKIILLDLENLILDFALFRFQKQNFDVQVIKVTKESLYPKLSPHNLCICTGVLEHIKEPLLVYHNIYESLESGGILHGFFGNQDEEIFHVSPDLQTIREKLAGDFEYINNNCYKKL